MHSFVVGLIGIRIATSPRRGGTEAEDFLNSKGARERLHALLVVRGWGNDQSLENDLPEKS